MTHHRRPSSFHSQAPLYYSLLDPVGEVKFDSGSEERSLCVASKSCEVSVGACSHREEGVPNVSRGEVMSRLSLGYVEVAGSSKDLL